MSRQRGGLAIAVVCAIGLQTVSTADVVTDWSKAIQQAIRETGGFESTGPGPVSRIGALVHVAVYDAVNSITRTHEPYLGFFDVDPGASKEAAAAMAAYTVLSIYYPNPQQTSDFDALLTSQLAMIPEGPSKDAGVNVGIQSGLACLNERADDGWQDYIEYTWGGEAGAWVPTFPDYTAPWGPHWCNVTPWTMTSGDQFRPKTGPYGYNDLASLLASPEYAADFQDVYENGSIFSTTRTEDQTLAAQFWANDRNGTFKPPGHLLHITEQIAAGRGNSLEENARLFALVCLGMGDAGIAAWDSKYATPIDLWRPITGIWEADTDSNPATDADPTWLGLSYDPSILIFNPSFPAWASGHATFGAVHAAIVRNFYGTDAITFSATSDDTPGYWRTFTSLDAAARENGRSRIWLGVHWQMDADGGYEIGTALGNYISANFLRILGDLNGDGLVNGADLGLLLSAWGATEGPEDLDRSGLVDGGDLGLLLGNWSSPASRPNRGRR